MLAIFLYSALVTVYSTTTPSPPQIWLCIPFVGSQSLPGEGSQYGWVFPPMLCSLKIWPDSQRKTGKGNFGKGVGWKGKHWQDDRDDGASLSPENIQKVRWHIPPPKQWRLLYHSANWMWLQYNWEGMIPLTGRGESGCLFYHKLPLIELIFFDWKLAENPCIIKEHHIIVWTQLWQWVG